MMIEEILHSFNPDVLELIFYFHFFPYVLKALSVATWYLLKDQSLILFTKAMGYPILVPKNSLI